MDKSKRHTYNYETIADRITTSDMALSLSDVTYHPSVLVERCSDLLQFFIEEFIGTPDGRNKLADEMLYNPAFVTALLFSILDQLCEANTMLLECQNFKCEEREVIAV